MSKLYELYGLRESINEITEFNERALKVYTKLDDAKAKTKEDVNITLTHKEINTILGSIEIAIKIGKDFVAKMKRWDEETEEFL